MKRFHKRLGRFSTGARLCDGCNTYKDPKHFIPVFRVHEFYHYCWPCILKAKQLAELKLQNSYCPYNEHIFPKEALIYKLWHVQLYSAATIAKLLSTNAKSITKKVHRLKLTRSTKIWDNCINCDAVLPRPFRIFINGKMSILCFGAVCRDCRQKQDNIRQKQAKAYVKKIFKNPKGESQCLKVARVRLAQARKIIRQQQKPHPSSLLGGASPPQGISPA